MAKSENFGNEERSVAERLETQDSSSSRRRFIRNIAIGTAGAAVAMSNLDRLRGASRLLERLTNAHVEGFMDHIKEVTESPKARQEFQRISTLILEAVDGDPKSRETFNAIKYYLTHPVVPVPEGVKLSDVDMVMGAGYLRAIDGIQNTTRHVTADDVKKRLQNPKAILHIFDSGFLNQLYATTKAETASNPSFAKKIADASREAKGVASHLVKEATSGNEARLVRANFLQGGCDCDLALITGTGTASGCGGWEACVAIIALIVVIMILK
jgi:hypothetical protein